MESGCPGEAHSNAYIDNCALCMQRDREPEHRCNDCRDTGKIKWSDRRGEYDWEWCGCAAAAPAKARHLRARGLP
jgi:hypothetical protein